MRERESRPTYELAYMNKSRVGERKMKTTNNEVACKNKPGAGESVIARVQTEPPIEGENKQLVLDSQELQHMTQKLLIEVGTIVMETNGDSVDDDDEE